MKRHVTQQSKMLKEIMGYDFTAVELTLYLDTHPDDARALTEYNMVTHRSKMLKAAYEKLYGPLMVFGHTMTQCPWRWTDEPWPWEVEF